METTLVSNWTLLPLVCFCPHSNLSPPLCRRHLLINHSYWISGWQTANTVNMSMPQKLQESQLLPTDLRDALYQLKCWPAVVRIMQTDRVSAWGAYSATATFYSAICMYTHRWSRLNSRTVSMRSGVCHHHTIMWSANTVDVNLTVISSDFDYSQESFMAPHNPPPVHLVDESQCGWLWQIDTNFRR